MTPILWAAVFILFFAALLLIAWGLGTWLKREVAARMSKPGATIGAEPKSEKGPQPPDSPTAP